MGSEVVWISCWKVPDINKARKEGNKIFINIPMTIQDKQRVREIVVYYLRTEVAYQQRWSPSRRDPFLIKQFSELL